MSTQFQVKCFHWFMRAGTALGSPSKSKDFTGCSKKCIYYNIDGVLQETFRPRCGYCATIEGSSGFCGGGGYAMSSSAMDRLFEHGFDPGFEQIGNKVFSASTSLLFLFSS